MLEGVVIRNIMNIRVWMYGYLDIVTAWHLYLSELPNKYFTAGIILWQCCHFYPPDSPINISLLALFCEMLYRFPNMAVANLSRESVREALMRGITAEQVRNDSWPQYSPEEDLFAFCSVDLFLFLALQTES